MLTNETTSKLHEMHLGVMAEAFAAQMNDPQYNGLSFEDRFSMLVDAEWTRRKSNRLRSLIRAAGYAAPSACVEDISYAVLGSGDHDHFLSGETNQFLSVQSDQFCCFFGKH